MMLESAQSSSFEQILASFMYSEYLTAVGTPTRTPRGDNRNGDSPLVDFQIGDSHPADTHLVEDTQVADTHLVEDTQVADTHLAGVSHPAGNQAEDSLVGVRFPLLPAENPVFEVLQRCR